MRILVSAILSTALAGVANARQALPPPSHSPSQPARDRTSPASTITVPAGFTSDGLPTGITFQGRQYSDGTLIKLAYAYEQATHHRKPPSSVPDLTSEDRRP